MKPEAMRLWELKDGGSRSMKVRAESHKAAMAIASRHFAVVSCVLQDERTPEQLRERDRFAMTLLNESTIR